jgi:osmoprotectant transport system permease protein
VSLAWFSWAWVWSHLDEIWDRTLQHIVLTVIAVVVGLGISLALATYAVRHRATYAPITVTTGALYTIPSLALFALLVPWTGLSVLTAEIGLVSYTLLILITNIVAGVEGVSPAVVESALGMGYTRRELLWRIQMPIALPLIITGIRIAAVTTIGLVTVTALIGEGGLGFFILRGVGSYSTIGTTQIIVGTVLSFALAIVVDLALVGAQRALTPWVRAAVPA